MATLELIRYSSPTFKVVNDRLEWIRPKDVVQERSLKVARGTAQHKSAEQEQPRVFWLPQICWANGSTWGEANLWALELANSKRDRKTTARAMSHLGEYAKWLEAEGIDWWNFPARESERCLTKYRGALVRLRDAGEMAPSSATQRMGAVVRFYRWVAHMGLLSPDWPMWSERSIGIKLTDPFGLEHTLRVASTDLAIPNRKIAGGIQLEDGILPVSRAARKQILELADSESSEELALMLRLGFLTGLRLGSITDLRVDTILHATTDPVPLWFRLVVGPGARPPVATKFGVSGMVPCPSDLRDRLIKYISSTRRLKREALANDADRSLVFLTRFGHAYSGDSRAINVEMMRLRRAAKGTAVETLRDFHFHRSRATFATDLMRVALQFWPVADAVEFVCEACLHKDVETTLRYVRFIERTKAMAEAADAFTEAFMGLAERAA